MIKHWRLICILLPIIYSHKYIKAKVILMLMICQNINDIHHNTFEQIINKEVKK